MKRWYSRAAEDMYLSGISTRRKKCEKGMKLRGLKSYVYECWQLQKSGD